MAATGLGHANELFQYVDQPGGCLQNSQALRQLFPTINVIEQFQRPLVTRMPPSGFAELIEPARQLGAADFEFVVTLAKTLPRCFGSSFVGAAGHDD